MLRRSASAFFALFILGLLLAAPPAARGADQASQEPRAKRRRQENAQARAESIRKLAETLGVGPGAVVADIGAGKGQDTWTFAKIVGPNGKVFSEEITEPLVDSLKEQAQKRSLPQVQPVLGTRSSPKLPEAAVDLAYLHFVYHHFSQPREMLRGIWHSLKPGGYLVVVDRNRGTLRDWVPRAERAKKHYWIAETTVVREAREEGFAFVRFAEDLWYEHESFVLVFQRPTGEAQPGRDPDPMPPIPDRIVQRLIPSRSVGGRVAFVALGRARRLIPPILRATGADGIDIVLEEWATQRDERPESPDGVQLPSVLTVNGDPHLGPKPLAAVYFLDTYHLLFHGPTLLARLREHLADSGLVYVLDRAAKRPMTHREASHRRMIPPELVKQEMRAAGFELLHDTLHIGDSRFLLVFAKHGPVGP